MDVTVFKKKKCWNPVTRGDELAVLERFIFCGQCLLPYYAQEFEFCFLAEDTINSRGTRTEAATDGPRCSHAQQQLYLHRAVLWGTVQRGQ